MTSISCTFKWPMRLVCALVICRFSPCCGNVAVPTAVYRGDKFKAIVPSTSEDILHIVTDDEVLKLNSSTLQLIRSSDGPRDSQPIVEFLLWVNDTHSVQVVMTCNDFKCHLRSISNESTVYHEIPANQVVYKEVLAGQIVGPSNLQMVSYQKEVIVGYSYTDQIDTRKSKAGIFRLSDYQGDKLKFSPKGEMSFVKAIKIENFLLMFSLEKFANGTVLTRLGFINPAYSNIKLSPSWLNSYFDMEISCGTYTVLGDVAVVTEAAETLLVALYASTTHRGFAVCVYTLHDVKKRLVDNIKEVCGDGKPVERFGDSTSPCKITVSYNASDNAILTEVNPNQPSGYRKQFHGRLALHQQPDITKDDMDGSSVETEVVNNNVVAYVGTSDGRIVKMSVYPTKTHPVIHWSDCSTSATSPIMTIKVTKDHHLFALSKNQVVKMPVQNCGHHMTCDSCIGHQGNTHCGWCVFERRCTMAADCVPQYFKKCLAVTKVSPDVIEASDDIVNMTLTLPEALMKEQMSCRITSPVDKTVNISTPATNVSSQDITCFFPNIDQIKHSSSKEKVTLAVGILTSQWKIPIIETNIVYVDCQFFKSCRSCLDPAWHDKCTWYGNQTLCVSSCLDCNMTRELVVTNHTQCPIILDFRSPDFNESKVYISHERLQGYQVHAYGENLVAPHGTTHYTCGLKGTRLLAAQYYKDGYVKCNLSMTASSKTLRTHFQVFYGDVEIENTFQNEVEVYNCNDLVPHDNLCKCASFTHYQPYYQCRICGNKCADSLNCDPAPNVCPPPKIHTVFPLSTHINSSVLVTIKGTNLGSHFNDTRNAVTVAGIPCEVEAAGFVISQSIVCKLPEGNRTDDQGQIKVEIQGHTPVVFPSLFSFRVPVVESIHPKKGRQSGGTLVTVSGTHMDTGRHRAVLIGGQDCQIIPNKNHLVCQTTRLQNSSALRKPLLVEVQFDETRVKGHKVMFKYLQDPKIMAIEPKQSFESGGRPITVSGERLWLIQNPSVFVWFPNMTKSQTFGCLKGKDNITCPSPPFDLYLHSGDRNVDKIKMPHCARLGFLMDKVTSVIKPPWSKTKLLYHPDPTLNSLSAGRTTFEKVIQLNGIGLNLAANQTDVKVMLGSGQNSRHCELLAFESTRIAFSPPDKPPVQNVYTYPITVHIGFYRQTVGYLEYEVKLPVGRYIVVGLVILVISVTIILAVFLRKSQARHRLQRQQEQIKMDKFESTTRAQCRQEFAALQTAVSDLTGDLEGVRSLYRDYFLYMESLVFHEQRNSRTSQPGTVKSSMTKIDEDAQEQFMDLLRNEKFLLSFVRILEKQTTFSMRDRSKVATEIFLLHHGDIVYITRILKTLLKELVDRNISSNTTRLLMRRSDSICEKMLTHWLSVCMYHELKEKSGSSLYILYMAIRTLVEKGPLDCLTNCAKYSMCEDQLLIGTEQNFNPQQITLAVTIDDKDLVETHLEISAMDCDTISQTKEKIIERFYKNVPFSKRPSISDTVLALQSSTDSCLELSDQDHTNIVDGTWQKVNTLKHYNLTTGMHFKMMVRNSEQAASASPVPVTVMVQREASRTSENLTLWHLTKPFNSTDDDSVKLSSDIFLPRMLTTKETLQRYIDDLFRELFVMNDHVPLTIKYLLDFLDVLAYRCNVTDPDVIHSWKCNSLMLRFWVNIIKNPEFVFDIHKPVIVDSCLSVVAQTLMDSCSTANLILDKHSPSNKLLFAKDIPRYKQMVQKFFRDIKERPAVTDEDFNIFLAGHVSGMFLRGTDTQIYLQGLISCARKYKDVIFAEFQTMETSDKDFQHFRDSLEGVLVSDIPAD